MEFSGNGDPAAGGDAADWSLFCRPDGRMKFLQGMAALKDGFARAYFTSEEEARAAGDAASLRDGLVSVLEKRLDPKIPASEIRRLVGSMHVGTPVCEVREEVGARMAEAVEKAGTLAHVARDVVAQAEAYAEACHLANTDLVIAFRM